ncbi:MAG: damage-inducible protein CinA [Bacteroidales bacterium 45-6]|nr:MAG: damage-inducible protein CinA [Bacteroidales bacterium 45-6]
MKVALITIGDEILIGQIVDTNSAWMAHKLTLAGFEVREKISIGDDASQIRNTIDEAFKRVDVVLTTGGLGPTKDDITKKTLCDYYGTELVFSDEVLDNIKGIVSDPAKINELTRNQAFVPKDCTVIQNKVGTAPVTWFEREGKILVSMPGVPLEMQWVMEAEVIPRLQAHYKQEAYLFKVFLVSGYTESALAIHLTEFENNLPADFGLAYLPSPGIMKLRLFVQGEQRQPEFVRQVELLEKKLGNALLCEEDIPLEKILGNILKQKGLTLATAESCTGGHIAHKVTSISGSSAYFEGCVVSYSNKVKTSVLNVPGSAIENNGAVSEEVVRAMAKGVAQLMSTDCAISVSGIAGPDGGTPDKPVGTVWICTQFKGKQLAQKYQLGRIRDVNILRATNYAMLQLLEMLK